MAAHVQSFALHAVYDSLCSIDRSGELQRSSVRLLRSKDRRFMAGTGVEYSPHALFLARIRQWYRFFVGANALLVPLATWAFVFPDLELARSRRSAAWPSPVRGLL